MANNNLWIGAGTPKFAITGNKVGIGTSTPAYNLDVSSRYAKCFTIIFKRR